MTCIVQCQQQLLTQLKVSRKLLDFLYQKLVGSILGCDSYAIQVWWEIRSVIFM